MTKLEKAAEAAKATRNAKKAAEAGALASKWNTVKTAVATQSRNLGAGMKESKLAEDMVRETLSGGANNVTAYYQDDTVKDKNLAGAVGMFISGAAASAVGANISGSIKSRMRVSGYSGDIARVGARGRATDVAYGAIADTIGGLGKNSLQYYTDNTLLGKPLEEKEYRKKLIVGAIKDSSKSSIKGTVKMDADVAGRYRNRIVYPMYQAAEAARNPAGAVDKLLSNMFLNSVVVKAIK